MNETTFFLSKPAETCVLSKGTFWWRFNERVPLCLLHFLVAPAGGRTRDLLFFVYFLSQLLRLRPLGWCAPLLCLLLCLHCFGFLTRLAAAKLTYTRLYGGVVFLCPRHRLAHVLFQGSSLIKLLKDKDLLWDILQLGDLKAPVSSLDVLFGLWDGRHLLGGESLLLKVWLTPNYAYTSPRFFPFQGLSIYSWPCLP